jgi:hypothetical protein
MKEVESLYEDEGGRDGSSPGGQSSVLALSHPTYIYGYLTATRDILDFLHNAQEKVSNAIVLR